jgi:plasmid stabilization system protein ParE
VDEAHAWYHAQSPALAREFLQAVNTSFASIQRHPEAHQLVDRTTRRALLRRFPYAVFFEVGRMEIVVYAGIPWRSGPAQLAPPKGATGKIGNSVKLTGNMGNTC